MSRHEAMKRVFICSPYRATTDKEQRRNIEYATELTRRAVAEGAAPFTPHLYLPKVLDDSCPTMRATGLRIGLEYLAICDEVCVGARYGITVGMREEISLARAMGIPVKITGL